MTQTALAQNEVNQLISVSVCVVGITLSAIAISLRVDSSFDRSSFLKKWLLGGIVSSLLPLIVWFSGLDFLLIVFSGILGVYFGLGAPVGLGYFAVVTKECGRLMLSGIIFFLVGAFFVLLKIVLSDSILLGSAVLPLLLLVGLISLRGVKQLEDPLVYRDYSYYSVFTDKTFLLYFVPWIIFIVFSCLVTPALDSFFPKNFSLLSNRVSLVLIGIFALVSGFLGDVIGRKHLVVSGFALSGIAYVLLTLFPLNVTGWWIQVVLNSIAWGMFYPIFLLTMWGDLSKRGSPEKYYTLGSLPFVISVAMEYSGGKYLVGILSPQNVFSFVSIFLFLAVLPLAYAPETLTEKIMKKKN